MRHGRSSTRSPRPPETLVARSVALQLAAITRSSSIDAASTPRDPAASQRGRVRRPLDDRRAAAFLSPCSSRVIRCERAPWDALWWDARIHLALFVHRVDGIAPGLYLLAATIRQRWIGCARRAGASSCGSRRATRCRCFCWRAAMPAARRGASAAIRTSPPTASSASACSPTSTRAWRQFGPSFYRHLFWESGMVGQVLYLEAEAAGARAHRHRLLLRRPGPRRARARRPRVPEPLSLHRRHAGRRRKTHDATGIRVGTAETRELRTEN